MGLNTLHCWNLLPIKKMSVIKRWILVHIRAMDGDTRVCLCMCMSYGIWKKTGLPVAALLSFFRQAFKAYHRTFSSFSDTLFRRKRNQVQQVRFQSITFLYWCFSFSSGPLISGGFSNLSIKCWQHSFCMVYFHIPAILLEALHVVQLGVGYLGFSYSLCELL